MQEPFKLKGSFFVFEINTVAQKTQRCFDILGLIF